jgi:hypothetical protein
MASKLSKPLYNFLWYFDFIKARGILSRVSTVDRLKLSPEEQIKLTCFLIKKGLRKFTWTPVWCQL